MPRRIAALILLALICRPAIARTVPGLSAEVREVLAQTHFQRPPSRAEKDAFLRRLRRRGIETLTDLKPYLDGSEPVRANALLAMEHMGDIDTNIMERIEELAHTAGDSPAPSVALAVRIILKYAPPRRALELGSAIAPQANLASLYELMSWIRAQDQTRLAEPEEAAMLTTRCFRRLRSLFGSGRYSGKWPLRFSLIVEHPPFDDPAHIAAAVDAFLAAVSNAGGFTDLEEIALVSAFEVVARAARRAPNLVEARLTSVAATAPLPVVHLILWRMSADGLDATAEGMRIRAKALRRFPDLAEFVERLHGTDDWRSPAGDELKEDIRRAFAALDASG